MRSTAPRRHSALGAFFAELARTAAQAEQIIEAAEYLDPFEYEDSELNDLPAINYAMNAGLPVIGWSPAKKNANEAERVARAARQFDEQMRLALMDLTAGRITLSQFYDRMEALYRRQATNAYVAGKRAMGDLRNLSADEIMDLDDAMGPDIARIRNLRADIAAGGFGSLLTAMILDPTNYLGSGLPGDPFAGLPPPLGAGKKKDAAKQAGKVTRRFDQYGNSIRQYSHKGELAALTANMPGSAALAWWVLGPADHCIDCVRLSDGSPYYADQLDGIGIHPGSGHTRCGGSCQCYLQYDIPSQVCADPFFGPGLADLGILESNGDGSGRNVWIQEAAACRVPMDIRTLNPDAGYDVIDDSDAFEWDSDMLSLIRGSLDESLTWPQFESTFARLAHAFDDALAVVPGPRTRLQVTRYAARDAEYHVVWQETAEALRFEIGATTSGMTVLDPDFTLRAMHDLAERAAAVGKRLEVNGDLAGEGLTRWLNELGGERLNVHGNPPTITPRFATVPKPEMPAAAIGRDLLAEVESLPSWPEMSALKDVTPEAVSAVGGTYPKRVMVDPAGNQWLLKQQPAEVAAAELGHALGLRMPPVRAVELDGVRYSMQPLIPNVETIDNRHMRLFSERKVKTPAVAEGMTDEQMAEMARHAVLDYVIANTDAHFGQFVVDDADRLWGIDKGMAFAPAVAAGKTPESLFLDETTGGTFGTLIQQAGLGRTFHKMQPDDFARVLDRLDAMSDAQFLDLIGDAADLVAEPFGTAESRRALLLARKNAARDGFGDLLRAVLEQTPERNLSDQWIRWLDEGGTFRRAAAISPEMVAPAATTTDQWIASLRKIRTHEEGVIIDAQSGALLHHLTPSTGATGEVRHTAETIAASRGNINLHNHPTPDSGFTTSFSRPDLASYAEMQPAVAAVVTDRFTYVLEAPDGWPSYERMSRVLSKIEKREKARRLEEIRRINALGPRHPDRARLLMATADMGSPHSNMALMADELGLVYRRLDVTEGIRFADAPRPLKIVPAVEVAPPAGAEALPIHMRSTSTQISKVGNNHAAWQEGFVRPRSKDEAFERLAALLPVDRATMDGFTFDQLQVILARAEHLRAQGFDLSVIDALTDFRSVPVNLRGEYTGLTLGGTIRLNHANEWAYFPGRNTATAFNDIGGVFAHEYAHALFHDLSTSAQSRIIELHKAVAATARRDLSKYATESLDEWFSEALAAITAPGYVKGSIKYDDDLFAILAADGRLAAMQAAADVPAYPALADLSEVQMPVQGFKGQSAKAMYVGDDGAEWLVKQPKYGAADVTTARVEAEVTRLYDDLGVPVNRVGVTDDGRTIQRIVEDAEGAWFPAEWSDTEWADMADNLVVDHLVGNVDAHKGQFLRKDGRVIAIDKDVGLWGLTDMRSRYETFTNHAVFEAFDDVLDYEEMSRLFAQVLTPERFGAMVAKIEAISDEAWLARWRPHIPALLNDKGALAPTDIAGWEALLLRRKQALRADIEQALHGMLDEVGHEVYLGGIAVPDNWRAWLDSNAPLPAAVIPPPKPVDIPVAAAPKAADQMALPLPPEPPPLSSMIAKGPFAKSTEMVPLDTLDALAPDDPVQVLAKLSHEQRQALMQRMVDVGPTQPVLIEYHPGTHKAMVTQGYTDIAMARFLGHDYIPARVVRRNQPFDLVHANRTVEVRGPVGVDHVPYNMKPSEMLGDRPMAPGGALGHAPAKPEPPPTFITTDQSIALQTNLEGSYVGWTGSLADEEAAAIGAYVTPSKRGQIDGFLDNRVTLDDPNTRAGMRATIDALDRAIDRGRVPTPLTVYRGYSGRVKVGGELDFRTFMPATTDVSKVGGDTVIRFRLVEGDTAVPITNGMLLPRDSSLKVTRVRTVTIDGKSKTLVDADLIPPRRLSSAPATEAPSKAFFAPLDDQVYTLPHSDVPLNAPRQQWSGKVPEEPPLPTLTATPDEKAAARAAADAVTRRVDDVASGKVEVAYSWTPADDKAAKELGLATAKIGDAYLIGASDEAFEPFRAYFAAPGATKNNDEFWHLLGYSDDDLDIIDRANDITRTKRLSAGVVVAEPDGRMWILAPKNEWAGYQNTWIKGGVDEGETAAAGAVREMYEEAGLTVELDSYLGDYLNSDGTGITRMYIGHRTGGGPLWAHVKETHEIRLVTPDEAKSLLTRHKKPDVRDQAILADAVAALDGTPGIVDYTFGIDEVGEFAAKTGPATPTPPRVPRISPERKAAINPLPEPEPHSVAFGYDPKQVNDFAATATTTPPAEKFPYNNTRYTAADGTQQPTYWRIEPAKFLDESAPVPPPPAPIEAGPQWQTAQEMVDDLSVRYGAESDFDALLGLDFDLARPVMQELDALFDRYGAVGTFRGVKVAKGHPSYLAKIERLDPKVPGSYLFLPEYLLTDKAAVEKALKNATPDWAVMGNAATPEEFLRIVTAHEVGHEYMGLNLWSRFGEKGDEIRTKVDTWFKGADGNGGYLATLKSKGITKYGKKNPHEAWAEAFAAAVGPHHIDDPQINELRAILNAQYPPKAKALPVEATVKPTKRLFWANSKKQLADPQQRLAVHVAHIRHLAQEVAADTAIGVVRVSDELLDNVPGLADILTAAGAKKVVLAKKSVTEIGRHDFLALADSIAENTPLPDNVVHIPTAPLTPEAKNVVTIGDATLDIDEVGDLLTTSTHIWNEAEPSANAFMLNGQKAFMPFGPSLSQPNILDLWGSLPAGTTEQQISLLAAHITASAKWMAASPGATTMRIAPSLLDTPAVRLWAIDAGFEPAAANALVMGREQVLALYDDVFASASAHGDALDGLVGAIIEAPPPATAVPDTLLSDYLPDAYPLKSAVPTFTIVDNTGVQQGWSVGGLGYGTTIDDLSDTGVIIWKALISPAGASLDNRTAFWVRQMAAFADRAEMFGLDSVRILEPVANKMPGKFGQLLQAYGVDVSAGDVLIDLEELKAIRALANLPTALDAPLTWPPGAPLADVLTPDINAIVDAPGTINVTAQGAIFTGSESQSIAFIQHGTTALVETFSTKAGVTATATGKTADLLRLARALADEPTVEWKQVLFRSTELTDEFRGILAHYGASLKAGYVHIDINDLRKLRDDIVAGAAAPPAPAVAVGPTATVPGYDAATVAGLIQPEPHWIGVLASAQDGDYLGISHITSYQSDGLQHVVNWQVDTVGAVHTIIANVAESPIDTPSLSAFIVKMRKVMADDPSIGALYLDDALLDINGLAAIKAAGATLHPGAAWRLGRDNVFAMADQISASLKSMTQGATAPPGSSLHALKATASTTTTKIDAYTPLNVTEYGTGDRVTWRRLSNDLQVHTAMSGTGTSIGEEGWAAHWLTMSDYLDDTPKVKVMRIYADAYADLPPSFKSLLDDLKVGKPGKGGQYVLSREEVLKVRDELLAAPAPTAAAAPSTPAFEPVLGPQYGFNEVNAGALTVTVEPLKWNFYKGVYSNDVTVRHRQMAKDVLWTGVSGGDTLDQHNAMARWLADMGDHFAANPHLELGMRFESLDKMPSGIRSMLEDHGAQMSGKYLHISRDDLLKLRDALTPELGHDAAKTVVAATTAPSVPSFAGTVGFDASLKPLTPGISMLNENLHVWKYDNGTSFSVSTVVGADEVHTTIQMGVLGSTTADDALHAFMSLLPDVASKTNKYGALHLKDALLQKMPWGQKVNDALMAAGATKGAGVLIIEPDLAAKIVAALDAGDLLPPASVLGSVPPPSAVSNGAKLSAQLGYNPQALADANWIVTSTDPQGVSFTVSSPVLFGDIEGSLIEVADWHGVDGNVYSLTFNGLFDVDTWTPLVSESDFQFAWLKSLIHADGIVYRSDAKGLILSIPNTKDLGGSGLIDLLVAHGGIEAPPGTGFMFIDKQNLHALRLKIAENVASPPPIYGSAASLVSDPVVPDPVALLKWSDGEVPADAGAFLNTGKLSSSPDGGMVMEYGPTATFGFGFTDATGKPTTLANNPTALRWKGAAIWEPSLSSDEMRKLSLAALYDLTKLVDATPSVKMLHVELGALTYLPDDIGEVIAKFGGVDLSRDQALALKGAIEDALNLAPISAASQSTTASVGGWTPAGLKNLLDGDMKATTDVIAAPGGYTINEYGVAGSTVYFKWKAPAGDDFVWESYALAELGPQMQKDALGVMLTKSLTEAQTTGVGLLIHPQVVENNPGIKTLLADLTSGKKWTQEGVEYYRVAGYEVSDVLNAINANVNVVPKAVADIPTPPAAVAAATPAPAGVSTPEAWTPSGADAVAKQTDFSVGIPSEPEAQFEKVLQVPGGTYTDSLVYFDTDYFDGMMLTEWTGSATLDQKYGMIAAAAQHAAANDVGLTFSHEFIQSTPGLKALLDQYGLTPFDDGSYVLFEPLPFVGAIMSPQTGLPGAVASPLGKFGIDAEKVLTIPPPTVTELKYNFVNHTFAMPSGDVTVKLRVNASTVSWEGVSAKSGVSDADKIAAVTATLKTLPEASKYTFKAHASLGDAFENLFEGLPISDGKIVLTKAEYDAFSLKIIDGLAGTAAPPSGGTAALLLDDMLPGLKAGTLPPDEFANTLAAVLKPGDDPQLMLIQAYHAGLPKSTANAILHQIDPTLSPIQPDLPEIFGQVATPAPATPLTKYGVPEADMGVWKSSEGYWAQGYTQWKYDPDGVGGYGLPSLSFQWKNYKARVAWAPKPLNVYQQAKFSGEAVEAAIFLQAKNLIHKAASSDRVFFMPDTALRGMPHEFFDLRKMLDDFGATKKELKVGHLGLGRELNKQQVKLLDEALQSNVLPPHLAGGVVQPTATIDALSQKAADMIAPPPAVATPTPVPEPVVGSSLSKQFGYDEASLKNLVADMGAPEPSLTVTEVNITPKTQVYDHAWANTVTVRWAEEQFGDARILRIRSATGGSPGSSQTNALLASMHAAASYLDTHPTVDRLLINKKALAANPNLQAMLVASPAWKETKDYFVAWKADLFTFIDDIAKGDPAWAVGASNVVLPSGPAPALGAMNAVKAAPGTPTPEFIYDFDHAKVIASQPSISDVIGAADEKGAVPHTSTFGANEAGWSVSPSGKTVGWSTMTLAPGSASERSDAAFAMLRKVLAEVENRPANGMFWVRPEVYDQAPGLRQILLDAGGAEFNPPALGGTAIQMTNEQARNLAAALDTNAMGKLKVQAKSTADYLLFDAQKLDTVLSTEPGVVATGHVFKIGDEATTAQMTISGTEMTFYGIAGGTEASNPLAAVGEVFWAANNGIERLKVGAGVVAQVPKFDKFLIAVGGIAEPDGIVLDAKALNTARKIIGHDGLPTLLGGDPLPYSIIDELASNVQAVFVAGQSELKSTKGIANTTTFIVNERGVTMKWQRSGENLFWQGMDRGSASVGAGRTATAAQLRSFLNEIAQNASITRLDVSDEMLAQSPFLREVLSKYGAKEVGASKETGAYLTLERNKALKLRKELEAELADATGGGTYIQQQAASIVWPTVEELAPSVSPVAKSAMRQGQTRKAVFIDKAGNEWLFKPGATGRGALVDKAAAELAQRLGLPVPPVRIYELEYEGKRVTGSLQKMVPNAKGISSLDDLNAKQTADLMRHSVLDWLVNNDDAHIANWLVDDSGNLWSIDKSRGWQTFHDGSHDVLNTASNGNGGGKPLIFQFWAEAARDPKKLAKLKPNDVAQTFRRLRDISDDEFRRIVEPAARANQTARYKNNTDKLIADMIARKNEAVTDFERYFAGEVKKMLDGPRAGDVPPVWKQWLDEGGKFNLDATPKDLWQERLVELNARFGEYTPDKARQLMHQNHLAPIRSELKAFFDGGAAAEPGEVKKGYGGEFIRDRLKRKGHAQALEDWYAMNQWVLLNIVTGGEAVTGSSFTRMTRQYWNEETGTFRLVRVVTRRGHDPNATLDHYRKNGMRDILSTSLGPIGWGGGSGVVLYLDVPYDRVFSSWSAGFGLGASEAEFTTYMTDVDWIVHARRSSDPLPTNAIMSYNGPVLPK